MAVRFRILASGSSGNATLIEAGGTRVLLDAGLGPRVLAGRLRAAGVEPDSLAAIVLSHEHVDHIKGAAAFAARFGLRLMGSRGTRDAGGFASGEAARCGFDLIRPGELHTIEALSLTALAIPHDAAGPLAFVFEVGPLKLGHATDLGHLPEGVAAALAGVDALVLESNHDAGMLRSGPYPWPLKERINGPQGHLSNSDAAGFLAKRLGSRCRTVVLAHLSEVNNHPEVARMAAEPALARAGRGDVRLEIATREGTGWIEIAAAQRVADADRRQFRLW
mgnify:CR=1 FL=1